MNPEQKKLFSERILTFVNKYLKHHTIVKATDSFYAKGELDGIIQDAFNEGVLVGKNEKIIDNFVDKIEI